MKAPLKKIWSSVKKTFQPKQKLQREQYLPKYNKYKVFAQAAYKTNIPPAVGGYNVDPTLSSSETKVFVNPKTKHVTTAYRGTALADTKKRWKDVVSDLAIATGLERFNPRFQQADKHFQQVQQKYGKDYTYATTGHSLGGQISKYVNDRNKGKIKENVAFSRGSGLLEPFRKKQKNTVDISNVNDAVSLGARLSQGRQVREYTKKGLLHSHKLQALFA
jgi:hypothetical protein